MNKIYFILKKKFWKYKKNSKILVILFTFFILTVVFIFVFNKIMELNEVKELSIINKGIVAQEENAYKSLENVPQENNNNFSKKIECEKFINQKIKAVAYYNYSQKPFIGDSEVPFNPEDPALHLYLNQKEFKEVFYSPKIDSCLFLEISKTLINQNINAKKEDRGWGVNFEYYNLIDILSNKEIESIFTVNHGEKMDSYSEDGTVSVDVYKTVDDLINNYKK